MRDGENLRGGLRLHLVDQSIRKVVEPRVVKAGVTHRMHCNLICNPLHRFQDLFTESLGRFVTASCIPAMCSASLLDRQWVYEDFDRYLFCLLP